MANRRLALSTSALLFAAFAFAQKNSQTLVLPKDPPLVAVGDTSRLVFHVSPLSSQGPMSQQMRAALKAILKLNGGAQIVHIRAFSAGNGDARRIPQIVSEVLGDKHGPLPSVSVVQVGALPLNDSQIVLETVSLGKKEVNKDGLTFYPAETAVAPDPNTTVRTLLQKAIDQLAEKMNGKPPVAVTCYVSDLDASKELVPLMTSRFAGAATNIVQSRRLAWQTEAACEGVARGGGLHGAGTAFSGTQIAFGVEPKDATVALERLDRALTEAGAPTAANGSLVRFYLLSPTTGPVALKQLSGPAPASTLSVEGVGPSSAGFAIDAVAPLR